MNIINYIIHFRKLDIVCVDRRPIYLGDIGFFETISWCVFGQKEYSAIVKIAAVHHSVSVVLFAQIIFTVDNVDILVGSIKNT